MEFSTVCTFLITSMLLTLAPGPDILFVTSKSMAEGAKQGVYVTCGLVSGVFIYSLLASLGLLVMVRTSYVLFEGVRILGIIYLLYLAQQAWKNRKKLNLKGNTKGGNTFPTLYRTGLLMSLFNPKLIIFFLAFFPQFVALESPKAGAQILFLGVLFCLQAFLIFYFIAYSAARFTQTLREKPKTAEYLNLGTAAVLFGIALWMAIDGLKLF